MTVATKRQGRKATPKRAAPAPKAVADKQALGVNELGGLCAEAFEAHDMADERVRFDSLGRKWSFWPAKRGDHSVLSLRLEHGEDAAEDHISTHILGSDLATDMIADVVRSLDRKV